MAWLVARTDLPMSHAVRALVTASFVTPPFLGAVAWEILAAPNSGLLNQLYRLVTGAPQDEYLLNIYSLPGLMFVVSCYTFPYVFVLIANALDRIPSDLEDASAMLGAGTWTTARRVTIPLAVPALLAGVLIAFLQAMILFGSPAILALPAGFHTMTTKIWSLFQYPPKPELAAAASLPLLVLTVILLQHAGDGRGVVSAHAPAACAFQAEIAVLEERAPPRRIRRRGNEGLEELHRLLRRRAGDFAGRGRVNVRIHDGLLGCAQM